MFPISIKLFCLKLDEWMTSDFASFSTVFQSYQEDGRMIMKCIQWNPAEKISPRAGLELGIARSVGHRLTH